jgi:peptidoglycan/xylan/chitin deacetylase (PgdA/CDA1 family)
LSLLQRAYRKIIRQSDSFLRETVGRAGLYNYKQPGCRIIVYHGICKKDHTKFGPTFLPELTFEQHLLFYRKHFNVITLDDYFQKKFSPDKFNLCITFDDGFTNVLAYALPLLELYNLPVTLFITGIREAGYDILWNDFLNIVAAEVPNKNELVAKLRNSDFEEKREMMKELTSKGDFWNNEEYWLVLTDEQIKRIAGSRMVAIGSHAYYHNDLARISIDRAKKELVDSKKYLERITGRNIRSVAFPYGSYTPEVKKAAIEAGYDQLLGTETLLPGDENDPMILPRLTVNPFIPLHAQMQGIVKGYYAHWR